MMGEPGNSAPMVDGGGRDALASVRDSDSFPIVV
jgi:hypothetical protein